jgi:hypothetical protein
VALLTEAGEAVVLSITDGRVVQRQPCHNGRAPVLLHDGVMILRQEEQLELVQVADGKRMPWLELPEAGRLLAPLTGQPDQAYFAVEKEGVVCVRPATR